MLGIGALCAFGLVAACETSSHKEVRTFEYDNEPPEKRSESKQLDSDYKMQSEGEMKGRD